MTDMNEDLARFRAKHRERFEKLGNEEMAAAISRNMILAEVGMEVAADRLCEAAGDDRLGTFAHGMLDVKWSLYAVKGAHAILSKVQATIAAIPIARSGER